MSARDDALRATAYAGIARDLREFGYPDVTPAMVREVVDAWHRGDAKMPHGVVGIIIKSKMDEGDTR